jgi:DNA-binding transcriptional regulator YiaG
MEDLHRAISLALIEKPGRLAPAEIRFLRNVLLLEGRELATCMGTTPGTFSRWETGATSMGKVSDRLLRALVLLQPGGSPPMRFRELGQGEARPLRLRLELASGHWRAQALTAA